LNQSETFDLDVKRLNAGSPCCGAQHLPLGPNKGDDFKCQNCSKGFSREDLNDWVVFLEKFMKTCLGRGLPMSPLVASTPPFSLEQVAKARQACWAWEKQPADFTPEYCLDKFLVYSWLQTYSDAEDFSVAFQEALENEGERPRQGLVGGIKREYSYAEPDLLEICLAVSWFKSSDATGGNSKLAAMMTNKGKVKHAKHGSPAGWHKANPSAFKQHLQRLRDKAKTHGFYDAVTPDYWHLYG